MAEGSQLTYRTGQRCYERVCHRLHCPPWPATTQAILHFLAALHERGLCHSTAQVYVAAVRHYHLVNRLDVSPFADPAVKAALEGLHRLSPGSEDQRRPIRPHQLAGLLWSLSTSRSLGAGDAAMLRAAFATAHAGFLRVGEYTAPSRHQFKPKRTLTRSRLAISGEQLTLTLPRTKTNQYRPTRVVIKATGGIACPVAAMQRYLATRDAAPHLPLFTRQDGGYLTATDVNYWVRRHLGPDYSSHSFRIGAATSASEVGTRDEQVKKSGRWKSRAYKRYIRKHL